MSSLGSGLSHDDLGGEVERELAVEEGAEGLGEGDLTADLLRKKPIFSCLGLRFYSWESVGRTCLSDSRSPGSSCGSLSLLNLVK